MTMPAINRLNTYVTTKMLFLLHSPSLRLSSKNILKNLNLLLIAFKTIIRETLNTRYKKPKIRHCISNIFSLF